MKMYPKHEKFYYFYPNIFFKIIDYINTSFFSYNSYFLVKTTICVRLSNSYFSDEHLTSYVTIVRFLTFENVGDIFFYCRKFNYWRSPKPMLNNWLFLMFI